MSDETINTDINEIVLNAKGGFSADDSESELKNITKTTEELQTIAEEIKTEVESEVEIEGKLINSIEALAEESKELTDEEKHAIFIENLKQSKIKFHPIKHGVKTTVTETTDTLLGRKHIHKSREIQTNVTTNQFGTDYRKKRKNKNRMARASRKANR